MILDTYTLGVFFLCDDAIRTNEETRESTKNWMDPFECLRRFYLWPPYIKIVYFLSYKRFSKCPLPLLNVLVFSSFTIKWCRWYWYNITTMIFMLTEHWTYLVGHELYVGIWAKYHSNTVDLRGSHSLGTWLLRHRRNGSVVCVVQAFNPIILT